MMCQINRLVGGACRVGVDSWCSPIAGSPSRGENSSVKRAETRSPEEGHPTGSPLRSGTGWVILFVVSIAAIWLVAVFGDQIGDWWAGVSTTLTSADGFRRWVEGLGAFGPVAYVLAQTLQVILAPIPGSLFPPVGALAFGPWPALALGMLGLALGSAIVFLAARRWGRPLAIRLLGDDRLRRYEHVVTARGGLLLWLVFLLPLLPDDAVCALAGISGISFRRFMLIAIVGRVPAVAAGVFTMAGLEGAPVWVWAVATAAALVLLSVGLRYQDSLETLLFRITRREPHEVGPGVPRPESAADAPTGGVLVENDRVTSQRDPLVLVLLVVLVTTTVAAMVAVSTGVSGLAGALILIWGAILAVMVAWARGD